MEEKYRKLAVDLGIKVVEDENGDEFLEEIQDEMEYEQISDILMAKVEEKFDVEYFEPEQ